MNKRFIVWYCKKHIGLIRFSHLLYLIQHDISIKTQKCKIKYNILSIRGVVAKKMDLKRKSIKPYLLCMYALSYEIYECSHCVKSLYGEN